MLARHLPSLSKGEGNVTIGTIKNVVKELKNVCNSPHSDDDLDLPPPTEVPLPALLEAAGKLRALDELLQVVRETGRKVLVLGYGRAMDVLCEYARKRLRSEECACVPQGCQTPELVAQVARFTDRSSPTFVCFMPVRGWWLNRGSSYPAGLHGLRRRVGGCRWQRLESAYSGVVWDGILLAVF